MTQTKAKKQIVDMDEVVTRRILAEELDKKFSDSNKEWNESTQRYIGALSEDFTQKVQMLAEGIAMQIEANERKWHEHLALHGLLDKRINKLESEVLIA